MYSLKVFMLILIEIKQNYIINVSISFLEKATQKTKKFNYINYFVLISLSTLLIKKKKVDKF